jgi:membrane glycosyltransferase
MDGQLNPGSAPPTSPPADATDIVPGGMPFERPLAMPVQQLREAPASEYVEGSRAMVVLARAVVLLGTAGITTYGIYEMFGIVGFAKMTMLQAILIFFFAITLAWIAFACVSAIIGSFLPIVGDKAHVPAGSSRTALLMPIYNESAARTTAALQAMAEALEQAGAATHFEIVILSDSTNADAWIAESLAVDRMRRALRDIMPVWYRRRWHNAGRKAGNVEDFVKRWGGRYDYMIVMDADSIMSASTLVTLVERMQADPRLGILQTVPVLMGQWSLFSRLQQFASHVYGRVIACGVAGWSGDEGNYWGHNAIIRVAAFAAACGLPQLNGRRPFGGHILSHDFVEAALIRRGGWKVRMAVDLEGSWEESPPSLVDVAIRDRRWAQGNLQHSKVMGAAGLATTSRLHFLIGIMSYLSSPLWLCLLIVGFALTLQATLIRPEYFSSAFQLFPNWPVFDAPRMMALFVFTMVVLLTPKLLGILRTFFSARLRRGSGGFLGITVSALFETVLSALVAPIMMVVQTQHVIEILTGRDSGWGSQRRSASVTTWGESFRVHWKHVAFGILIGGIALLISPTLLAWLAPTVAGLLLAIPLSKFSGSVRIGRLLGKLGLLRIAEEKSPPDIVRRRDELVQQASLPEGDLLHFLARNRQARFTHVAGNLPRPPATRGHPDPQRLTAEQKVREAQSVPEALSWLTAAERVHVAGDPQLLERLATLPLEMK